MSDFGFASPRGSSKSGQGVPVRPNGMNMGPPLTASGQRGRGRGGGSGGGGRGGPASGQSMHGGAAAFRGSQMQAPDMSPSGGFMGSSGGGGAPMSGMPFAPRAGPPMPSGGRPREYQPSEYTGGAGGFYEYPKAYQPPSAQPARGPYSTGSPGQRYPGSEFAPSAAAAPSAPARTYEGT